MHFYCVVLSPDTSLPLLTLLLLLLGFEELLQRSADLRQGYCSESVSGQSCPVAPLSVPLYAAPLLRVTPPRFPPTHTWSLFLLSFAHLFICTPRFFLVCA